MTDAPALFSLVPLGADVEDLPAPANGPYFVATKSGYMAMQRTHWGRALVPVKEAPSLPTTDSIYWHDINLPPDLIGLAWGFFRQAWNERKTEAMVDITFSQKHGYRLFVPPQDCSHGGVHAKRTPEHYRSQIVGTIHSHCNFSAYHSGTDTHDADGHDGLHMTIGHVHEDTLDIACMLSSNGVRWEKIDLESVVRDRNAIHPIEPPAWWIGQLDRYQAPVTFTPLPNPNSGKPLTVWRSPTTPTTPAAPKPKPESFVGSSFRERYTSLDHMMYDLPQNDPRLAALDEIQKHIDAISADLTELGIDFDYEVEEAFTTSELARLNAYFHDMENQQ